MSAITNDPFTLARLAGMYKAVQSAGGAGSFGMDAVATPYLNELVRYAFLSFLTPQKLITVYLSSLAHGFPCLFPTPLRSL